MLELSGRALAHDLLMGGSGEDVFAAADAVSGAGPLLDGEKDDQNLAVGPAAAGSADTTAARGPARR
jgi:hypothetical protein